jgi:hypothetical protein
MSTIDEIAAHAKRLPEDLRVQALQFIKFLETKLIDQKQDTEDKTERGQQVAAILQELADLGAFSEIEDPVKWQHNIRADRSLPGRD